MGVLCLKDKRQLYHKIAFKQEQRFLSALVNWPFNFIILKDNRYRLTRAHFKDTVTLRKTCHVFCNSVFILQELVNCMFILTYETFTLMFRVTMFLKTRSLVS